MNENRTETTKWLQYLLYVGIAALVNTILVNIPIISGLTGWISLAISAATAFLLFKLTESNPRYKTAAVCYTVALIGGLIPIVIVSLACSVCSIVAQYQEYHAHGELIEEKDPKLADQWNSLFWLEFAVIIIATLLSTVLVTALVMAAGMEEAAVTAIVVAVVAAVTLLMKLLYLSYLNRTIKLVGTETLE
jgi:hypothetical protein